MVAQLTNSDYLKISPIALKLKPFTLAAWIRIDQFIAPHDKSPFLAGK